MEKEVLKNEKYGELVILGYNGYIPPADCGRKRSKLVLKRRNSPNGVKFPALQYISDGAGASSQYTITYGFSEQDPIIMVCEPDGNKDMFQIGRSADPVNDFVVLDTIPGNKRGNEKITKSTVSRFACRIIADRCNPKIVRVFACGFDSSKNIFLDKGTIKWKDENEVDGLPNNGILIRHPEGLFSSGETKGPWFELSVCGRLFSVRPSRSSRQQGHEIMNQTNILRDGTLIDLCGVTLLWRSAEGLSTSTTKQMIEVQIDELNSRRPLCPVFLNTLVIPRKISSLTDCEEKQQPYVNINCGHVQGKHRWGRDKSSDTWRCPICLECGPISKICIGLEPAFYLDCGPPMNAFIPCGHMASENTTKYWSNVPIPRGVNSFEACCPFCSTALTETGYVKLIFQDNVD